MATKKRKESMKRRRLYHGPKTWTLDPKKKIQIELNENELRCLNIALYQFYRKLEEFEQKTQNESNSYKNLNTRALSVTKELVYFTDKLREKFSVL